MQIAQLTADVFLCRDPLRSAFSFPLILWGVAFELALLAAIVYTPWGQALFGTHALPLEVWLYVLPFAAAMLALDEARKLAQRAWKRRPAKTLDQSPLASGAEVRRIPMP